MMRRSALLAGILAAGPAHPADPVSGFARYMPLYPALYATVGYTQDDRDRLFDQSGAEIGTTTPNAGGTGATAFPETRLDAEFTWHFPMWEADRVPWFSSRLHTASIRISYAEVETTGRLAQFAADAGDDSYTEADHLENNGSGVGDVVLEYGTVLFGTPDWRNGERSALAVTAYVGGTLPFGEYNRDAPANSGNNSPAAHVALGMHWRPWSGGFVDAGVSFHEFFQNYDSAFGQLSPTQRGDETTIDVSVFQRSLPGLYLGAFFDHRKGDPNGYEDPRFAPNAPPPNGDGSSWEPVPGLYWDRGTELTRFGLSAHYFITQDWMAGLYYVRPHAGRSGEFLLPFENHNPGGCTEGGLSCQITPGPTVLVDGLGSARTYANDSWMLTITHQFGQGDAFDCRGCEQP